MPAPSSQRSSPRGRGGRLPIWVLGGLTLLACSNPPPVPPPDLELAPVSERVVRLLERAPVACPDLAPEPAAARGFEDGKLAFEARGYARAAGLLETAARGFEAAGDRCRHVDALNHLGMAQRWLEQTELALATYARALDLGEQSGYLAGVAQTLNNLGALETRRQHYRPALEHFAGALALWRRLGNRQELALAQENTGVLLFYLGRWESAQRALGAAVGGYAALGPAHALEHGIALSWLGRTEAARGQLTAAETTLERALTLLRGAGDAFWIAAALDALGRVQLDSGRFDVAEASFEEARTLFRAEDTRDLANSLANLAELYERSGRPELALALCQSTLETAAEHAVDDPNLEMHLRFVAARAHHRQGRLEPATALMEEVMGRLEALRTDASGDLLAAFFAVRRGYYDFYVELLLAQGHNDVAFDAAELAKARGGLDRLVWHPSEVRAQTTNPALLARDAQARAELSRLGRQLENAATTRSSDPGTINDLAERARALRFELARLEAEMRAAIGGPRAAIEPLRVAQIQPALTDDTVLLVYWLGDERSVLWEVSRTHVRAHPSLPPRRHFEAVADTLRSWLAQGPSARRQIERELRALAPLVLGPLAGRVLPENLVIIPDGALALVPFAALASPAQGEEGTRLIEHHTIYFGDSVSMLAAIRAGAEQRHHAQRVELALVVDPVTDPDDPRLPARPAPAPRTRWPRLPRAEEEGTAVARWAAPEQTRWLAGFGANRERVLAGELGSAQLVHVAAHAELDPENPELSYLVLSHYDAEGRPRDGRLKFEDFDRLAFAADLVVLSGCRTAVGKAVRGESPFGFAQGFLYSGAAAVIASLGSVDDHATFQLMQAFYRELSRKNLSPALALRQAQLELARSDPWQDPAYWAWFVLLGDGKI